MDQFDERTSELQLGFVQLTDPRWFEARFFPSKVGGKPSWLNPIQIPTYEFMKCGICGDPLCFLMQIYAPLDNVKAAHHRMIYIFCCRRGSCIKKDVALAFKVLRSQLPKENPLYSDISEDYEEEEEPPEEDQSDPKVKFRTKNSALLCYVCGQHGTKKCSACNSVRYCGIEHQKLHWGFGKHSKHCKPDLTGLEPWIEDNPALFSEYEIITEMEADSKKKKVEQDNIKYKPLLDQYYKELEEDKQAGNEDTTEFSEKDLPNSTNHDPVFLKFQTTIDIDPSQVLRYTADPAGAPLWMVSKAVLDPSKVPHCPLCGSERIFELQILPQLIFHLRVQKNLVGGDPSEEIDWGVLIVYTCKASCNFTASPTSGAYAHEYLYHQPYE